MENSKKESEGKMTITGSAYLNRIMESTFFRIITILLGLVLFAFYGAVLFGAIVCHPLRVLIDYFPDSWLFSGIYLGGVISAILCFVYANRPKKYKLFFVIIVPFTLFMLLTLFGE